ncbi:MAG: DUF4249 domain-containing protein [Ichthyobacteriaceae bacterium]|nr:DUF4249 domain-containing protein [Ichthyobacteriaceae bacterium]
MKIFLRILVVLLIVSSCRKEADIDVPNGDPQLVVTNFITVNTDTSFVRVLWSEPIYNNAGFNQYNNNYKHVENADVNIINNGKKHKLIYDKLGVYYTADVDFNIGDKVELSVNYDEKNKLTALCKIPVEPKYKIEYLNTDSIYVDEWSVKIMEEFKFTALNKGSNYYALHLNVFYESNIYNYNDKDKLVDGVKSVQKSTSWFDKSYFELDENKSVILRHIKYVNANRETDLDVIYSNKEINDSIEFIALTCDVDYFKYHKSIEKYGYGGADVFTEPVIVYSNVIGGLGVFGAYNRVTQNVLIK